VAAVVADPTSGAGAEPGGEGPAEPAQRGTTVIADRVVERIASIAAAEVAGVVDVGSSLDKVIGRQYPKADAAVAGSRAKIAVEVAVAWPHPLSAVTAQVRDTVRSQVERMAGLQVDVVDVHAAKVVQHEPDRPRRVQ